MWQVETLANDAGAELIHQVPLAIRFDELKASVWVWANHPGIQVTARVRLPNQLDPRTGRMLEMPVNGEIHQGGGQWQRLGVDLSDRGFEETLRRWRSELARRFGIQKANVQGAYVDQISLRLVSSERVTWEIKIDDLELGPIVTPKLKPTEGGAVDEASERPTQRVRIGDDRVLLDGLPLFPVFMAYHGESIQTLERTNINLAWVPEYNDKALLSKLTDAGIGVMATPPEPDAEIATPEQAGLLPFTAETDPILFWFLDVQIPSSRLAQACARAEMVRDADRLRARPIMADVMGKEREYHRQFSLVGASRSILHTSKTPRIYADTLDQRRRMGFLGKPMFTLISTEPAEELIASRPADSILPVVEPEQIWMQANIALAAGFKGIGYLTFHSLDSDEVGAEERRRAIEIQNYQIRALEPWLGTAKVQGQARVQVGKDAGTKRSPLLSSWDIHTSRVDNSEAGIAARQIQATVLDCDQGLLILVNWLEENAQYQPGKMVAKDVRILLNRDIAQAQVYELTTTQLKRHTLDKKSVPGGTEITLKDFNQSTVILVTSDSDAKNALSEQLDRIRPFAATAWASLARAKLTRIRDVHHQLEKLAPHVNGVESVLRVASNDVDQAEKALRDGKTDAVEDSARWGLANMRTVQWAHWNHAIAGENSPASSPQTICFQTLPDHWRMKSAIKQAIELSQNLLKSGDFEDADTVLVSWTSRSELDENSPIKKTAALYGPPGASCLHMGAAVNRDQEPPGSIDQTLVTMISPAIPVSAGQIIRVRGRIMIKQPILGTTDGVLVYDSLVGTIGALRFKEPTLKAGWQEFEFSREVAHSGEMKLLFDLKGIGNVWLDDLQVTAIQPAQVDTVSRDSVQAPR